MFLEMKENAGLWGRGEMSMESPASPGDDDRMGGVVTPSQEAGGVVAPSVSQISEARPDWRRNLPRSVLDMNNAVVKRDLRGVGSCGLQER
jgi:hypothetical protein